jgi:hypothetical protein
MNAMFPERMEISKSQTKSKGYYFLHPLNS